MSAPLIRRAREEDLPAIADVLRQADLANEDINSHLAHLLVCEVEGKIVGTIGLEAYDQSGLLRSAAVVPSFRNRRIGEMLVSHLEDHARRLGIRQLVLLTTSADRYFRKLGFVRVAREEVVGEILSSNQFRGACPSSATVMRKVLDITVS